MSEVKQAIKKLARGPLHSHGKFCYGINGAEYHNGRLTKEESSGMSTEDHYKDRLTELTDRVYDFVQGELAKEKAKRVGMLEELESWAEEENIFDFIDFKRKLEELKDA